MKYELGGLMARTAALGLALSCLLVGCATATPTTTTTPPPAVQTAIDALAQAAASPAVEPGELLALHVLSPVATLRQTSRATVHIAARTSAGNQAFVGGQAVAVGYSGVFARDQIPLAVGQNAIELRVQSNNGTGRSLVLSIERVPAVQAPGPLAAQPVPMLIWPAPRAYVVGEGGADLTWGLHEVRLGGPNLAELPAGTRVQVDAQRGEHLRVRLTSDFEAWARASDLTPLSESSPTPAFTLNNMMLIGRAADDANPADTLSIPWSPRVPYAVRQQRGADGKPVLELEFFGGHLAATWLTHRNNPQVVEVVNVEQTQRERPLVRLTLREKWLWGYRVQPAGNILQVQVRAAPVLTPLPSQPLKGLRIALEAGHGGPTNLGAVGITGAREKDVNLATTWLVKQELERAGASVYMVREGDENPTTRERARLATASNAHLFVSIHANAAGTENGFLRAKGTSTFYKHEHGRQLAAAIHRRMLQATNLPDYGLVGNFNYTPIRLATAMPAVLVELAFMSNPQEEAQLLDPAMRQRMAAAIRQGIVDFICQSTGQGCSG